MRKIFLVCLVIAYLPSFAQQLRQDKKELKRQRIDSLMKQEEEGVINYHKQTDFGVKIVSDGYGIFMDIGRAKSVRRSLLYQVELGERKSASEAKQTNPNDASASPIIWGKENFFYYTKFGAQEQFLLANKANKNGVNITGNVGGGISLAILRPYYIEIQDPNTGEAKYVQPQVDSSYAVIGGPTIAQGWDKLSLTPGLYAKAAVRFDYGHYTKTVTALEIGLSGEYYTKKVPILFFTAPKQFFLSAYAAIVFGVRRK
jgi:hypothetical protein